MCAFQSCAMQQYTCRSREKRKWLVRRQNGFEFIVVVLDVWQKRKCREKLGKDTFLVWTRPSLSASVSPSAVSAAKPRILWCSCCFAHPSYHSAMSAINHCPRNGTYWYWSDQREIRTTSVHKPHGIEKRVIKSISIQSCVLFSLISLC